MRRQIKASAGGLAPRLRGPGAGTASTVTDPLRITTLTPSQLCLGKAPRAVHFTKPTPRVCLGEGVRRKMINQKRPLSRLTTAFGLALVCSLAFAVFAAASASALSVKTASESFPVTFVLEGSSVGRYEGTALTTCASSRGSGKFESGTTGQVTLTLKGCTYGEMNCWSAGQEKGTIVTSALSVQPVYLDAAHTKYGLLLKSPASGVFADFTCGGGLLHITWNGPGVIARMTSPALGTWSKIGTLELFGSKLGTQEYEQVEGAGTKYHLTQTSNGGSPGTMALSTTWTLTSSQLIKFE